VQKGFAMITEKTKKDLSDILYVINSAA